MATQTGVNPHRAWVSLNGALFPVINGSATVNGTRQSSHWSATIPINYPGAQAAAAGLCDNQSGVIVQSNGKTAPLVIGEADSTTFNYGQNGTIVISGRDNSVRLHNKKWHGKLEDKTTVQVVEMLAGMVGLGVIITGGSGMMYGKKLDQNYVALEEGQSFAAIIAKCAELDNARWFVDVNSVLHYEIDPQPIAGFTVFYQAGPPEKSDAFQISMERNIQAGKTIHVFIKGWHDEEKDSVLAEAVVAGCGTEVQYEFRAPNFIQDQAQKYAQSKANEIARHEITVHAHVIGDPIVTQDSGLGVSGTAFDGTYLIDQIQHTFGMGGHKMTITARSSRGGRTATAAGGAVADSGGAGGGGTEESGTGSGTLGEGASGGGG
jgi:hypothetical protein